MESALRKSTPVGTVLIETLGYRPGVGLAHADLHLARMAGSARALGYDFDNAAARQVLEQVQDDQPLRVRLTCAADGAFDLTVVPAGSKPKVWTLALADQPLQSDDIWLRHKTTNRALYDTARANLPTGIDELIFLNERGEVCEGTIANLFVRTADGRCLTPALKCGLLPGILRQRLLMRGLVKEAVLTLPDLKSARCIAMGNSLRGLIRARLA